MALVSKYSLTTFFAIAVITAACGWVSVERFSINSEMNDLIEQDTAWRRDFDAFAEQFPRSSKQPLLWCQDRPSKV